MPKPDFWSSRRAAVAREKASGTLAETSSEPVGEGAVDPELSDEDLLESLGLPDPETFTEGQDVAAFMARNVPARLRRAAFRAFLRVNPDISPLDGLLDYDDDYTDAAVAVPGGIRSAFDTAVQISERLPDVDSVPDEASETPPPEPLPHAAAEPVAAPEPTTAALSEPEPSPDEEAADEVPRPRRMTFRFD